MILIPNRRCAQLGLSPVFDEAENPFPWMSEAMDLKKEKNFFETRVIEYQNGGALCWVEGGQPLSTWRPFGRKGPLPPILLGLGLRLPWCLIEASPRMGSFVLQV